MWIAWGTSTLTRQYGTAVAPRPAVPVDTDSIVTGGPSATSETEPIPAASHVVTWGWAYACIAMTDVANAVASKALRAPRPTGCECMLPPSRRCAPFERSRFGDRRLADR